MSHYFEGKAGGGNLYFCEPETVLSRKSIYPKNGNGSASDLIYIFKDNLQFWWKPKINLMKFQQIGFILKTFC